MTSMAAPLQAILLDLDDTLIDTSAVERRRWVEVSALIRAAAPNVDLAAMTERYKAFDRGRGPVDTGVTQYDDFRATRLRHALAPWTPVSRRLLEAYLIVSNAIADEIQPLPGAVMLIEEIRSRGIPLAVVTNGPSAWQRRKLELTGIGALVDATVISAEIGRAKPDPLPFLRACELLGAEPAGALMIGDNAACDIAGAEAAGLRGALRAGPEGHAPHELLRRLALRPSRAA
jgi:putative hydrolase of the HAD superfamily